MSDPSITAKAWGTDGDAAGAFETSTVPMADLSDAADFQRYLQGPALPHEAGSQGLGDILRSTISSLHEHERAFDKSLRRTARTGDPVEALAVQRNLSELYISHGLVTKVIGKTAQALETLMRLQ